MLPCSGTYDYRSLVCDGVLDENALDSKFDSELYNYIDKAITSENVLHGSSSSASYKNVRKLRIRMIICMLCMAMNPANSFLQTILGVIAYLYGLRDKGFDILNAFGVTCSVDQVRKHGSFGPKNVAPQTS